MIKKNQWHWLPLKYYPESNQQLNCKTCYCGGEFCCIFDLSVSHRMYCELSWHFFSVVIR